jgi:hypothetical protein
MELIPEVFHNGQKVTSLLMEPIHKTLNWLIECNFKDRDSCETTR